MDGAGCDLPVFEVGLGVFKVEVDGGGEAFPEGRVADACHCWQGVMGRGL